MGAGIYIAYTRRLAAAAASGAVLLVGLEVVVFLVQTLEHNLTVGRQVGPANRCHGACEEARAPFFLSRFALGGLFALPLFDLRLECCGERVLSADDGVRYAIPELERFVGQLLLHGGNGFGEREKRVDVDDEVLLLCGCEDSVWTQSEENLQ